MTAAVDYDMVSDSKVSLTIGSPAEAEPLHVRSAPRGCPIAAVPDLTSAAPDISPALDPVPGLVADTATPPLVEPMDTFRPRLERVARIPAPTSPELATSLAPLPKRVSHRQFQTALDVGQGVAARAGRSPASLRSRRRMRA